MLKRVYLEITNSCNLNCPFCTNEKGNKFLDLDTINDYLIQIKPYCNYIYLHILGEPLLHRDFNKILDLLDKYDFNLQLVTNGTLLNKHKDILCRKCLRKLSISLHSINNIEIDNEYFKIVNDLIESNTDKYIELRFYDKTNLNVPLTNYLNYLKDKYAFDLTTKVNSYQIKKNTFVYFEELFKWPNIDDPIISETGKCHGGIDMIAINSNSDVTLCCLDPNAHNSIGNLKNNSLKEILESDEYLKITNELKSNKISKHLCKRCTYRLRF